MHGHAPIKLESLVDSKSQQQEPKAINQKNVCIEEIE
jgi:hypothetical protein